jgi:hypothetical protein
MLPSCDSVIGSLIDEVDFPDYLDAENEIRHSRSIQ